jgi:thioredoxin reductase (NADPH)
VKHQSNSTFEIDVAIVGAGPIWIEPAIAFKELGIDTIIFESRQIGNSISRWERNTQFYSNSERISLAGIPIQNNHQLPITGEDYLAYLRMLVEYFDLRLHNYETVTDIKREGSGFILSTKTGQGFRHYQCNFIIIATGSLSKPRRLNIPGEDLPHVHHYFADPHQYFRTRVMIIGGKNSAIETALRCWRVGAQVAISYRRADFDWEIIKPHLAQDIKSRIRKGEIDFLASTIPDRITPEFVSIMLIDQNGTSGVQRQHYETDFVLSMIGYEADTILLKKAGVRLEGEEMAPIYNPMTMETNVSGLFVAGTIAGGSQVVFRHAIFTSHDHVARIVRTITGQVPKRLGTIESRNSDVSWDEIRPDQRTESVKEDDH